MNRILHYDGSTLTDLSTELDNYHSGTTALTLDTDHAIYIGQKAPFNHIYFKLSNANTTNSVITVKLWDGTAWCAVGETLDQTISSGKTMGQSGFVTWQPDRDESGWMRDNTDEMLLTDLVGEKIYDRFWIQITVSATFDAATTLSWLGNLFSTDEEMYSEYPILAVAGFKTAFEAGKADWEEQHVRAAKLIIDDMVKKNLIHSKGQILDRNELSLAALNKVAEIAFRPMGDDYRQRMLDAGSAYRSLMKRDQWGIDTNQNADLEEVERKQKTFFASR